MSCQKCESIVEMREYFKSNCICDILISQGNCENCLYYGEYCTCDIEYVFDSEEIRKSLTCPISFNIFINPVIASDGHTYERRDIELWISKSNKSPMTGKILESYDLYPNYLAKSIIKNCKKVYKNKE